MGQKVNPIGLRLGIINTWNSLWYAKKDYSDKLHEDLRIINLVKNRLKSAGISKTNIERPAKKLRVVIHAARPGMIIGRQGDIIDKLKKDIEKLTSSEISINIVEVRKPEIDPRLIAESIAQQLEKRIAFKKAAKRAVQTAMRMGAKGIRVNVSGRLGGAEIARSEWYKEGTIPLHTFRADIDYGTSEASTTYGIIGIKVWVFKGEIDTENPKELKHKVGE